MSTPVPVTQALGAILLGGVLGAVGQGLRSIVVVKAQGAQAAGAGQNPVPVPPAGPLGTINPLPLVYGLLVGFVVGVIATLMLGLGKFLNLDTDNVADIAGPLVTILLAGYAGTDAIEGFVSRFLPSP